jgi:flagellar basal-body rod protein FlgB
MFEKLTLFTMARKRMDWVAERQEVLAQNIANADTPKYQARDVKPLSFKDEMKRQAPIEAAVTHPAHVRTAPLEASRFDLVVEKKPYETNPDGNSVILEEQMQKVASGKSAYELAANLMQKHIGLLRTAIGNRG